MLGDVLLLCGRRELGIGQGFGCQPVSGPGFSTQLFYLTFDASTRPDSTQLRRVVLGVSNLCPHRSSLGICRISTHYRMIEAMISKVLGIVRPYLIGRTKARLEPWTSSQTMHWPMPMREQGG